MSAIRSSVAASRSPVLAVRRIDSAMIVTWDECTGSGRVATAVSRAVVMISITSGGNAAFEKSFMASADHTHGRLEGNFGKKRQFPPRRSPPGGRYKRELLGIIRTARGF
jgi:hypothetical protein